MCGMKPSLDEDEEPLSHRKFHRSYPTSEFLQNVKLLKSSLKSSVLAPVDLSLPCQMAVLQHLTAHNSRIERAKARVDTSPPLALTTPLGRKNEKTKQLIRHASLGTLPTKSLSSYSQSISPHSLCRSSPSRLELFQNDSNLPLVERMNQFLKAAYKQDAVHHAEIQPSQVPCENLSLTDKISYYLNTMEASSALDRHPKWKDINSLDSSSTSVGTLSEMKERRHWDNIVKEEEMNSQNDSSCQKADIKEFANSMRNPEKENLSKGNLLSLSNDDLKLYFKQKLSQHIVNCRAFSDQSLQQVCYRYRERHLYKIDVEVMDTVIEELFKELGIKTFRDRT